jgi:pimeloyl-ACP methyl ester carboxylesterase
VSEANMSEEVPKRSEAAQGPLGTASGLRRVEANGVRFALIEEGKGPLVLLLHGFPDTAHTWDKLRPELARAGYRAVSPFMRGYAPSSIPQGGFDTGTLGRDVLALIEALGEKRAIVIGHDWGAAASYSAATLGPERVELLVTVGIPHPASIRPTPRLLWIYRHLVTLKLPGAAARARKNDFALVDKLWRRWSPAWDVPPSETESAKVAFREPGSLEAALGYYRARRMRVPASERKRITVPTVSFAGTDDHLPPEMYEQAASWFTGGYRVVRVPGGHFMHREHPERFNPALLEVLASRGRT